MMMSTSDQGREVGYLRHLIRGLLLCLLLVEVLSAERQREHFRFAFSCATDETVFLIPLEIQPEGSDRWQLLSPCHLDVLNVSITIGEESFSTTHGQLNNIRVPSAFPQGTMHSALLNITVRDGNDHLSFISSNAFHTYHQHIPSEGNRWVHIRKSTEAVLDSSYTTFEDFISFLLVPYGFDSSSSAPISVKLTINTEQDWEYEFPPSTSSCTEFREVSFTGEFFSYFIEIAPNPSHRTVDYKTSRFIEHIPSRQRLDATFKDGAPTPSKVNQLTNLTCTASMETMPPIPINEADSPGVGKSIYASSLRHFSTSWTSPIESYHSSCHSIPSEESIQKLRYQAGAVDATAIFAEQTIALNNSVGWCV